jgi:RHS repeat-associated protein
MSYDSRGQLVNWTAQSGKTASDTFLYDAQGNRVLQSASSTSNGVTTVTDTLTFDGDTETTLSGGSKTTLTYDSLGGQRLAVQHGSKSPTYLVNDLLGSTDVAVKSDGSIQAVQLYWPYGAGEYSWGTMPTSYNFTGQRLDSVTGLLYFNARYYDPLSGRFVRADTVQNNGSGMDPFAYVGDSPIGTTDPSGQYFAPPGGSGNGNPPPSCSQLGTCGSGDGRSGSSPSPALLQWTQGVNIGTRATILIARTYLSLASRQYQSAIALTVDSICTAFGISCSSDMLPFLGIRTFEGDVAHGSEYGKLVEFFGGAKNLNAVIDGMSRTVVFLAGIYYGIDFFTTTDPWRQTSDLLGMGSSIINLFGDAIAGMMGWDPEMLSSIGFAMGIAAVGMQAAQAAETLLNGTQSTDSGGNTKDSRRSYGGGGPPFPPTSQLSPWWYLQPNEY